MYGFAALHDGGRHQVREIGFERLIRSAPIIAHARDLVHVARDRDQSSVEFDGKVCVHFRFRLTVRVRPGRV